MAEADLADDFAHRAGLTVAGMERARRAAEGDLRDELGEVFDIEHAAPVFVFGKYGQFARQRPQRVVVALAAVAIDHGRAQDGRAEAVALQRAQRVLRVQLALPIGVDGRGRRFGRNKAALARPGRLTKDDHAGEKDEVRAAVGFGLLRQIPRQLEVDGSVRVGERRVGADVGDARRVDDAVVSGQIEVFPPPAAHADGLRAHAGKLAQAAQGRRGDEAASAGDENVRHPSSPPRARARPRARRRGAVRSGTFRKSTSDRSRSSFSAHIRRPDAP